MKSFEFSSLRFAIFALAACLIALVVLAMASEGSRLTWDWIRNLSPSERRLFSGICLFIAVFGSVVGLYRYRRRVRREDKHL